MLILRGMKTKDAIESFGNVRQMATALGISREAIYQWGDTVPPLRAYQIRDLIDQQKLGAGATAPEQKAA